MFAPAFEGECSGFLVSATGGAAPILQATHTLALSLSLSLSLARAGDRRVDPPDRARSCGPACGGYQKAPALTLRGWSKHKETT